MRKISGQSVNAFLSEKNFSSANMQVINTGVTCEYRLHGNMIAYKILGANTFHIQNCGWFSNTTKERLNALPNVSINQKKGVWFLNGEKWNGQSKEIQLLTFYPYIDIDVRIN